MPEAALLPKPRPAPPPMGRPGLGGDAQPVLAVGKRIGHLDDLLRGGAAREELGLDRLRVRPVFGEEDAVGGADRLRHAEHRLRALSETATSH